jgi:Zn2+/Cd2+-exporting ATPase
MSAPTFVADGTQLSTLGNALRKARLDVHFLMLAVAGGAALIGAWHEGALLLFLFSASGAMEHYAMGRTRREISVLFRGAPKTARVLRGGSEERDGGIARTRDERS